VFETAGAGALIGVIALIDDSPRPANAVAKTACRLAPIDSTPVPFSRSTAPVFRDARDERARCSRSPLGNPK
jgi:hypothetical protein